MGTAAALVSHNIPRHPICNTPGLPRQVQGPQVHEFLLFSLYYRFTRPGETRLANLLYTIPLRGNSYFFLKGRCMLGMYQSALVKL